MPASERVLFGWFLVIYNNPKDPKASDLGDAGECWPYELTHFHPRTSPQALRAPPRALRIGVFGGSVSLGGWVRRLKGPGDGEGWCGKELVFVVSCGFSMFSLSLELFLLCGF